MARKTDREKAEKAMQKVIDEDGYSEFSITLCPACNEPKFADDMDPNQFVDADRTAWQISPQKIIEKQPENPWDHICVTAKVVDTGDGEGLRVRPHMHDYSMEVYDAWQEKLDEMEEIEQRKQNNQGLGDFA